MRYPNAAEDTALLKALKDSGGIVCSPIERLRHDIERYIAMASELATENERLRAENSAAWDAAEDSARRARLAEAAIEKLREYAEHDAECRGQPGYDIPCSCGYDELMKDLEESK